MQNENDAVAEGNIWHVAYHPFKYLDILAYLLLLPPE